MKYKIYFYLLSAILLFITSSCGIYSFTGSSLHPDIKTIEIKNLYNNSGGGPPYLEQSLTQSLKDYFQQNSKLTIVNANGDLQMEGGITVYSTTPIAPTATANGSPPTASSIRLNLTVKIKVVNTKDEEGNFEKDFTTFQDFDATKSLQDVERDLIQTMNKKLSQDIFIETVANW